MVDEQAQEAAIRGMNGFEIEGRPLRTDRARPRNRYGYVEMVDEQAQEAAIR